MASTTEKVTLEVTVELTQNDKWRRLVQRENGQVVATLQVRTEKLPGHLREAGAVTKAVIG